jgi:hypothetical protein
MPLNRQNTKTFHINLYKGWSDTVTIKKRANDQNMGQIRTLTAFNVREKKIHHEGEPLRGTAAAGDRTVWQVPRIEMDRLGITEFNALDQIIGPDGQTWQVEANDGEITIQLGKNVVNVSCRRVPGTGS